MSQSEKRISISSEAVTDILLRLNILSEELGILSSSVNKSVTNAELQGWNDNSYYRFKEEYDSTERQVKDILSQYEEVLIPNLKKILNSIENF